jgi:hypothetical protein
MKIPKLAFLFLLATIGCGESAGPKVDPAIGGYALTKVNGNPLPVSVTASGDILSSTAVEGSLFFNKDGTYSGVVYFRIVRASGTTTEPYGVRDGVWLRRSDTELQLLPKTGTETSVRALITTSATTVNVISQGLNYEYARK